MEPHPPPAVRRGLPPLLVLLALAGCGEGDTQAPGPPERDYRQDMRGFVEGIAAYARSIRPGFLVVPQNGNELLTLDGEALGPLARDYADAIDGVGREDLLYGYLDDDVATPPAERDYMIPFLDLAERNGIEALVTDYCWTPAFVDRSYRENEARGYISFAADHRSLDNIPAYPAAPHNAHPGDVTSLAGAKNFLLLLNPGTFPTRDLYLAALRSTDYDLLVIDLFYDVATALTAEEIASLKAKAGGGRRPVLAYLSVGEAEDYRYYWRAEWRTDPPSWLAGENPNWPGNYKVRYWDPAWQRIVFGDDGSYVKRILDAGFDGVYLDVVDAFEYFEAGDRRVSRRTGRSERLPVGKAQREWLGSGAVTRSPRETMTPSIAAPVHGSRIAFRLIPSWVVDGRRSS